MKRSDKLIELLAPARNYDSALVAIDYGADAVYMGGPKFGARQAAGNSVDDIAKVVAYARRYGVRVYTTLNTLVFESEIDEARKVAQEVIDAGVDALIVQDMAYVQMGLQGVELHASTQTFNASPEKVKFLQDVGFSRVILERGLTLDDIKSIRAATDVDLECFVHGAICVCNSGRCWMSRATGPRSGNRGECSQPCRMTYDLVDERGKVVIKGKHLLSVQDYDLSDRIGDMLDAGVTSFKIEGRLKDLNYVKNTVSYYRRRLDDEIKHRKGVIRSSVGDVVMDFEPDLSKSFTRGRSQYFFDGKRGGVASFDTPKAIGSFAGKVVSVGKGWFEIGGSERIDVGDGICFFSEGELVGTNVNRVEGRRIYPNKEYVVGKGTDIYRNYDHAFTMRLERSRTRRVIDASVSVELREGYLRAVATDVEGNMAESVYEGALDVARDSDKALDNIRTQVAKGGDSIFRIVEVYVSHDRYVPFIPASLINSLRREVLEKLLEVRLSRQPERKIIPINHEVQYFNESLSGEDNVTNSLAESFYREHGVVEIDKAFDLCDDLTGARVMCTPYCIRREIGECLKCKPKLIGELYLTRGRDNFKLEFDCASCMMNIVYVGKVADMK